MENQFRPTASGVRRGTEDKPVFAAGIEPPAWKRHLTNSTLVETYKDQIGDENRRAAQDQRSTERAQRPQKAPPWKSGIGTVKRKREDGTEEEFDANDLLDDPEVGAIAEESLFKKDIFETKSDVERRSLMLQDPSRPKRMTDRERGDMELEGVMLADDDARKQEITKRIADDDAVKADYSEQEKAIFEGKKRLMEMGQGGIAGWRERRQPAPTLQGAVANHEAVKSREAEFEQRGVELAAQEAELAKPVKGAELAATAPMRAEVAAKREQLVADRQAHAQEREQSAGTVAAQARREADAMDGKQSGEASVRQNLATQGGVGLTGVTPGMAENMKTGLNNATGGDADYRLNRIIAAEGGRENARKFIESQIAALSADRASGSRKDGVGKGESAGDVAAYEGALAALAKQNEVFSKAGITDPAEQDRLLADAAKESQWTENDTDKVRSLSTGELAINPAMAYGDRPGMLAEIESSGSSPAMQADAVRRLDAMRADMAESLSETLYYADSRLQKGYRETEALMEAKGITDKVRILDAFVANQKDRNDFLKALHALESAATTGGVGVYKTAVGTAAGVSGAGTRLAGTDGSITSALGREQKMLGDAMGEMSKAEEVQGITGGYGLTSEVGSTVVQMAPMLVGGQYSQGLQGLARTVVGGLSVYGWAAMQGYEAGTATALDEAQAKKGSDLTEQEIVAVLGDGRTQAAGFLNGAQTAILAATLGKGSQRAALGKPGAYSEMTVRSFVTGGGVKAMKDGVLRKELKGLAKNIFADAADEAIEEGLNQFIENVVMKATLDKDFKLGDVLAESLHGAFIGAIVGGGLPQVRGATKAPAPATPERVNAELLANDPDAVPATPEEVTAAADIVGADPVDAAEGVIISREIAAVEDETAQAFALAEIQLQEAQASGDKGAVTVAEANVEKARGAAIVGSRVRGALKIARGEDISTLTDAEARSMGIKRKGDDFTPMTTKELEAEGLTRPLLDFGADDSPVILDSVLDEIRAISPAAAARVKLTETEARKAAQERADIEALPDHKFTVTGKNGTSVQVKAKTAEQAQTLAMEDATWPMGEQVAGATINEKGKTTKAPVQVPPVSVGTPGTANPGAAGGVAAGAGPAEAKAEAPVVASAPEKADTPADALGNRTVAGDTGAAVGSPAVAGKAILRRLTRLRKNPKLAAAITISEDPADRIKAFEDGKIVINLKALAAEAKKAGLSAKDTDAWIEKSIEEEIFHLSQFEAADAKWKELGEPGDFKKWRAEYYGSRLKSDFTADELARAEELYGPGFGKLDAWKQYFEASRQVWQQLATGSPTEGVLLLTNRKPDLVDFIRKALESLKQFVANIEASPALLAEIRAVEVIFATFTNEQSTANPRNRPQKQPAVQAPDADVRGPEKDSDHPAPVDGAVEPPRRDPVVSAAEGGLVGRRVSWTRRGESLSGVVNAENEGFVIVKLDTPDAKGMGTANARVADLAVAPEVTGEKINKEWTAFSPESGTLGIPRAMMPQISAGDRSALVQFLKARGVSYSDATVPAASLKPTQTEYSPAKVAKAKAFEGGNRSILISSDNHVLDGHHQWMAAVENGEEIAVIRLDSPIRTLLPMVLQMPSVTKAGGEILDVPAPQAEAPAAAKPKAKKRRAVTDTPARKKAFEILREDRLNIISKVIGGVGKITAPPPILALVNAKRGRKEKLTKKELEAWEANQDYNAYLPKNDFGNDFWGKVAQELHGMIFVRGAGQAPDTAAEAVDKLMTPDTLLREIMAELNEVANGLPGDTNQNSPDYELSKEEERSMMAFDEANQEELGTIGITAGDLDPAADIVVTIAGEPFHVLANRDGMVTLEDGEKFGTQRMPEGSVLWIAMDESESFMLEEIEAAAQQVVDESEKQGYGSVDELISANPEIVGEAPPVQAGDMDDGGDASGQAGRSPAQGTEDRQGALSADEQALKDAFAGMEELDAPAGNEVGGWQARNSGLGERYKAAKQALVEAEAPLTDALAKAQTVLPLGYQTIPYGDDGMVALQDSDGNDIRFPLTPSEAATEAWNQSERTDRYAELENLQNSPAILAAREALKVAGEAWNANGDHPRADQIRQEMADREAAEQRQREAVAKGKRTKAAKKKDPSRLDLLENYFRPGKTVKGYGGEDRVISFDRGNGEMWSVTVESVDGRDDRGPRSHSTTPSNKDLIRAWNEKTEEAPTPRKPAPASKMDIRNADSRQLFADDGGFALGQDSTVDGAKVVAERKAKEDAKAAQDAAQRDMFSAPPALSPDEQALKDAFSGMVDGLDAAPLDRDADFYQSKGIPRDKRATFMDVADMLYDAGVRTPQDLAAKLEKVGGGKLRAYSDAVWSILRSNYPALPQSSDWAGIYSQINDTPTNDTAPISNLEPDRPDAGSPDGSGQGGVPAGSRPARGNGKPVVSGRNGSGNPRQGNLRTDDVPAAPRGESSDPEPSLTAPEPEGRPANPANADGSRVPDANGVEAYGRGENDAHDGLVIPAVHGTLAQGGKEGLRSVLDVKKSAPSLKVEQAEDVVFVETRLLTKGEPGVLLTNGTGTGKTFSGLGVVKRALDRGEKHVIIIAPSDKVVNDWIDTAREFFGIDDIGQLDGIRDNSKGNRVVVTTYANFGQNNDLVRRPWGMVVTDEAHYLSQAKDGNSTLAQKTFKGLTWHPKEGVGNRVSMEMAEELAEIATLRKSVDSNSRLMNRDDTMDQMVRALRDENRALETRLNALSSKVQTRREELQKIAEGIKKADRPKAVFLSATPFAYHFSLDYAEGYLFEHGPEPTSDRYNTPSARGRFYMENFGYRMRYGKLTQPENAAATGILERMFAERLKRKGAMRGRMLDVPFDYSRDFVLAESAIGSKIDEVLTLIRDDKRFAPLRSQLEIADYLARRYLLEGLKAREAVKRINEHLALGRKVVVFHDYKKNNAVNPLRLSSSDPAVKSAYETLRAEFNGFDELVESLDTLQSPINVIRANFPDAGFFNGDVPAKTRRENVKAFNQSGGKMNVILAQRAAGKEGISLHDIDAKHQRAFIDLGLPGRPTDAIQSEGRTIRLGMQSNGVLEYLTTGTSFERHTFAQTIATRASTAENLAMGENARSLLQAFSTGYNDARSFRPSKDQGTGGKKNDAARESGDPFDNAVALYFTNQKKTSRNKAEEGVDYFATPEPLGFKMVEWAGIRPGERVLEPSGGHGAIARFFPDSTIRHAVEPSYELAGRLALNAPDTKIHQVKFEDYDVINKFDAVVMNPPFGTAGKTAMDHLEKAIKHLKDGGRVVALIPNGSSMAKRFDKWYDTVEGVFMAAEIQLPSVTFERAGTSVSARIVILDKVKAGDANQQVARDFTSAGTTKELFERLKNSSVPDRPAPAVEKTPAQMMADLLNGGRTAKIPKAEKPQGIDGAFSAAEFVHTQKGTAVFVGRIDNKLSPSEYAAAKSLAKKHGGYYSSYNNGGAIPGFHFKDAETRDAFLGEAATPKEDSLQAAPLSGQQARIDKLMDLVGTPDPEILEEVATQQRVFKSAGKKVVGRPDLANPGKTEDERALWDQMDEARKWHATRETFGQWTAAANSRNTPENDANLIEKVLKNAAMADKAAEMEEMPAAPAMTPEDTIHFRLMMERRFRESGGNKTKLAKNAVLRNAYRSIRAAIARSLASGRDLFKTQEQRNRETLINLMTELPVKDMRQIEARNWSSPQARDKAVEEAISKRLDEFEKQMKKLGITLEEITNKEVFMSLSQNTVLKNITKNLATAEKMAVQMMQKGAGFDAIRRRTGLPEAKIEAIRAQVEQELRAKLYAKVKAGLTLEDMRDQMKGESLSAASLNAAALLSEEQIQTELDRIISVGFGIPKEIQKTTAFKPRKTKAPKEPHQIDWNRPEFTDGLKSYEFDDAGRVLVMRKVVALRDIVGAAGKVESLTGEKQAKAQVILDQIESLLKSKGTSIMEVLKQDTDIADYRFNIGDTNHVAMLARTIQAMNTDLIDKAQEYAFASMLSGLQTNLVNLSGGIVNSTWQATADRAFESITNLFFQDPANASFGEFKYMARAMGPALSRAWSNAISTWGSETSTFEEDILNRPPDLAKMAEGVTGYRMASIGGTKGRVIRMPLRALLAADNFVATARACVEVGAMAYRTARIGKLVPGTPEFEAFVKKEVNIPGSMSWQLAAQKAYEGNFNNAMPGQQDAMKKDVEVKTAMDFVGYGIQSISSALNPKPKDKTAAKLAKAVTKLLFFPFVRVPFNILKQGIDRSINPISLAEIGALLASNLRYQDGKWTLNADGQKQRIIESIGKQLQGTMFVALLLALGEGDDDDLEKKILITGSRPYKETRKGEREAGYRMGLGPYRISFLMPNGQRAGFNYGRIEPFATIGGGTVDVLKNVKASLKGRTTKAEAAGNILAAYVSQVNEKTMLRGASDLMAILNNEHKLDRFAADRIGLIMPNIIKQVVRESDGEFREAPSEFHDMVIHGIWPSGMDRPAKVDIYGEPQKKDGATAAQRIVDFTDAGLTGEAKDSDRMLYNWIRQNPENKEVPIPQGPDKNWTDPLTKQRQPMTAGQRAKFGEIAGTRLKAMTKGMVFNADKPSEFDMKRFKQAVDKSRDDARKILFRNPTWRALK